MTVAGERLPRPVTRFQAPDEATASGPAEQRGLARDQVRLLVARPAGVVHRRFADLPGELRPGDVLVVNTSATVAGELDGTLRTRARGGPASVVVHASTPLDDGSWVIELRTAPAAADPVLDAVAGEVVDVGPTRLRLLEPYPRAGSSPTGAGNRLWRVEVAGAELAGVVRRQGRPIGYGYLDRRYPLSDYQTVFSLHPGSAEMPSAGRPFTDSLVTRLVRSGVLVVPVTLHTGLSSQEAGEAPQSERFAVPAVTAQVVDAAAARGGRVIAVGTTATRAVESAVHGGRVHPAAGWTDRVVGPDDPPQVVTGLITGWHNPEASHLLLVEAVAGPDLTQRAYDAAVSADYLFHEFGDSCLLLPDLE